MDPAEQHAKSALGSAIALVYLAHCEGLTVDRAEALSGSIDPYLESVEASLSHNEFLDIELARRIAAACRLLLQRYPEMDGPYQSAVVGAVRYFIDPDDADHDVDSVLGFEDDAQVVNYVISLTGADVPPVKLED